MNYSNPIIHPHFTNSHQSQPTIPSKPHTFGMPITPIHTSKPLNNVVDMRSKLQEEFLRGIHIPQGGIPIQKLGLTRANINYPSLPETIFFSSIAPHPISGHQQVSLPERTHPISPQLLKIETEIVFCILCKQNYSLSERDEHLLKHRRSPKTGFISNTKDNITENEMSSGIKTEEHHKNTNNDTSMFAQSSDTQPNALKNNYEEQLFGMYSHVNSDTVRLTQGQEISHGSDGGSSDRGNLQNLPEARFSRNTFISDGVQSVPKSPRNEETVSSHIFNSSESNAPYSQIVSQANYMEPIQEESPTRFSNEKENWK